MRYNPVWLGIFPLLELTLNPSDYIWSIYDVHEVTDYSVMVLLCIIPTGYRTGDRNSDSHPWKNGVEEFSQTWQPANIPHPAK